MAVTTTVNRPACPFTTTPSRSHPLTNAVGATLAPGDFAALESREPGSPVLERYAALGRVLAGLPDATAPADARRALVNTLRDWTARLAIPGLRTYGLDEAGIPAIIADARGSSMRTNPVVLTDEELAAVLLAAL